MVGQRRKIILNTSRAKQLIKLPPDQIHPQFNGYSDNYLAGVLSEDEYDDFQEFMDGQTRGILNETVVTYTWDYRTWVEGGRNWD